jgi:TfoX/Sxy family transcriptional regulator of competence genes
MAFDELLAERIRERLAPLSGIVEKRMFGGLVFMVDGNMACGVMGEELFARVGAERAEEVLSQPGVRLFEFTGRPTNKAVVVEPSVLEDDVALSGWVDDCLDYVHSLRPK